MALTSLGLFIPILVEYFITHEVARFPTLIVSGCIGISALLSLFTGIILDVVIKKQKQAYEIQLTHFISEDKKNK